MIKFWLAVGLALPAVVQAQTEVPAPVDTAPVKVYAPGAISPARYTVIDRLWVARWRTAFDVPSQADAVSARRALLDEAVRAGGDGVVNLHCLSDSTMGDMGGVTGSEAAAHYCYGTVIKLK